jgi:hypothetical protein
MDQREKAPYDHVERFLAGSITLDELKDWLIGATWNIEDKAAPAAIQLAYAVELALAEESGGFLTTDELHADLRKLIQPVPAAR